MPPDPLTVLTQALYTSRLGTMAPPKGPEQVQTTPTLIGAPDAWAGADPAGWVLDGDWALVVAELVEGLLLDEHAAAVTTATSPKTDNSRCDRFTDPPVLPRVRKSP